MVNWASLCQATVTAFFGVCFHGDNGFLVLCPNTANSKLKACLWGNLHGKRAFSKSQSVCHLHPLGFYGRYVRRFLSMFAHSVEQFPRRHCFEGTPNAEWIGVCPIFEKVRGYRKNSTKLKQRNGQSSVWIPFSVWMELKRVSSGSE